MGEVKPTGEGLANRESRGPDLFGGIATDTELIGINREGNALMCRFDSETSIPTIVIAKTTGQLKKAICDEWLGVSDGDEFDMVIAEIAKHDFSADDARELTFDLEMGYVSFEDVRA